jgi:hypothetical protein
VDFVGPLPESKNRDATFNSITVVIDLPTGMVHLIPGRINYTARQMAELIFEEIYKLHGLPKSIVSDRDVLFTSTFWRRLHELIGVKLNMSSAYHPESDGGTERANRTVTQMLRQCIEPKQHDWVSKLSMVEFASTGYAPFFLNTGRMPRSLLWNVDRNKEFPGVATFALQRRLAIMSAHDSMIAARVKQTRNANRKRQIAPFTEGDLVYLSAKNIKFEKGLARKLIPKYIGPYKISRDFGNNSFQIDLPPNMKQRGVHDVFHASLLRIHIPNDDRRFPGRLECQLGITSEYQTNEWAVDRIVSHYGRRTESLFQILWKTGDKTWMSYDQARSLTALPQYLETQGISDIKELGYGLGQPPNHEEALMAGSISIEASDKKNEESVSSLTLIPTFLRRIFVTNMLTGEFDLDRLAREYHRYNLEHARLICYDRLSFLARLIEDGPSLMICLA